MAATRTLSHEQARRFYDRWGARQDSQAWYERPAVEALVARLDLDQARSVLEFGCGTGRLAAELLETLLPKDARYLGLDVSSTMVELAAEATARFGERAEIRRTDGSPKLDVPDASVDRVISCYVLDLLSEEDVRAVLAEARRVLEPGGRLGLVGLTCGVTLGSRVLTRVWEGVHRLNPAWVGGCRPLALLGFVGEDDWKVHHHQVVEQFGIASEVLVAERS